MITHITEQKMLKSAQEAMEKAYAPYSNFQVGCAILSDNDNLYTSGNVENSAYPEGSCAESGAISAMITGGDYHIKAILIISKVEKVITPCGGCLQKISEFAKPDTIIYLANLQGIQAHHSLQDLLPQNFVLKHD